MRLYDILDEKTLQFNKKKMQSALKQNNLTFGFEIEVETKAVEYDEDEAKREARRDWNSEGNYSYAKFYDLMYQELTIPQLIEKLFNEYDAEPMYDFADNNENLAERKVFTDSNQDPEEAEEVDQLITDYHDFTNFFNYNDMKFESDAEDWIEEQKDKEFEAWYDDMLNSNPDYLEDFKIAADPVEVVNKILEHFELKEKYDLHSDSSLQQGIELVTKSDSLYTNPQEALDDLEKLLNAMDVDDDLQFSSRTGLHINIGTFKQDEIDLLKLMILLDDDYLLNQFGRTESQYARTFRSYVESLAGIKNSKDFKKYYQDVSRTNQILLQKQEKYQSVNFKKLEENYLEFRIIGGNNMSDISLVKNTVLKYIYVVNAALKPDMLRQAYLSKLHRFMTKDEKYNIKYKSHEINERLKKLAFDFHKELLSQIKYSNLPEGPLKHVAVHKGQNILEFKQRDLELLFYEMVREEIKPSRPSIRMFRELLLRENIKINIEEAIPEGYKVPDWLKTITSGSDKK